MGSGKTQFRPQTRACSDSRDARPTGPSHYQTAVESSRPVQTGTIVSKSERPDVVNSSGACVLGHTERALSTILVMKPPFINMDVEYKTASAFVGLYSAFELL